MREDGFDSWMACRMEARDGNYATGSWRMLSETGQNEEWDGRVVVASRRASCRFGVEM